MDELEEERNSNEVWPEERLSELFRILQALCLKYLKATHLLPNLPFLRLHASRITKAERKSSPDATKLLFDLIKDCEEPEKWKKFTLALKEAEFISLYKVCNVCEKNDFDFYIEIYGLLSVDFAEHGVDIVNLSKGMLHSESLTEKQVEKIHLMLQEEGEIAAILEFISCLPSSLESWLTALRSCLFGIDKKDLCKLIQKKGVEIHDYNNIDLDPLIRIYYDRICMRVRPQDIRAFLKSHNLIPDMNLNSLSPSAEMCKILENIEKSEVAGKWRSFLNALKHAGYESLYMKLTNEGGDIDDTQQIELLKSLTPKISKSIDMTVELLSDIRKYELINERCYQEISKKKNESGTLAAAEMLLENIHKFKVGWYNSFLRILTEVGHEEVVKKIDPDFQYSESEKFVDEEGNKVEEYSESEKFVDEEGNKVEGNNDELTVNLPDSTMEAQLENLKINGEEELLKGASLGKNCIIYIFTRNAFALKIIKMHLDVDDKHKVVFLGKPRSVELQRHLLDTDSTNYQVSNFTNPGNESLENKLMRNQVLLLTPAALKNSNLEKLFSHFSLLLIDECHLTIKNHPFNELMKNYVDHKLDNSPIPLPQVIGLTSFSNEKPKNINQASDQLEIICTNLDCEELCPLQDANYFAFQSKSISCDQSDRENPFKETIEEVMSKIENHFKDSEVLTVIKKENSKLYVTVNVPINKRDGSFYTNWLADLKKGFVPLDDNKIRFHCMCCWWFLNMLRNAMEISTFCEIKHAYDYIKHELSQYKYDSEIHEILRTYWLAERDYVKILSEKPKYFNPQLEDLKNALKEEIRNNPWSRIVVFVQTPFLVNVILKWMMNFDELRALLPSKLKKSVYQTEVYKEMLDAFDNGECQLCLAVPEDSKKIQQKYNLRLDYFDGNLQDMNVQMEGSNFNPELLLQQAMIEWKDLATKYSEEFQDKIRKSQRKARGKRIKKVDSNPSRPLMNGEFNVLCRNCKEFACFSSEIRTFKGEKFFVCNPNFLQQVSVKDKMVSGSTEKSMQCPNCYSRWGNILHKKNLVLPELQINALLIADVSQRTVTKNEWQAVPFFRMIREATKEELEKMIAQ